MSNYNEAITANNTELSAIQSDAASSNTRLQAVLDKINALPDAGSVETCTVTVINNAGMGVVVACTDMSNNTPEPAVKTASGGTPTTTFTVAGNTTFTLINRETPMMAFTIQSTTGCSVLRIINDAMEMKLAAAVIAIPSSGSCEIVLSA